MGSHAYIYLISPGEYFGQNIFKIGMTIEKSDDTRRIQRIISYGKKTVIHLIMKVTEKNVLGIEQAIIKKFSAKYGKPVKGHEYFRGNVLDMRYDAICTIHDIECCGAPLARYDTESILSEYMALQTQSTRTNVETEPLVAVVPTMSIEQKIQLEEADRATQHVARVEKEHSALKLPEVASQETLTDRPMIRMYDHYSLDWLLLNLDSMVFDDKASALAWAEQHVPRVFAMIKPAGFRVDGISIMVSDIVIKVSENASVRATQLNDMHPNAAREICLKYKEAIGGEKVAVGEVRYVEKSLRISELIRDYEHFVRRYESLSYCYEEGKLDIFGPHGVQLLTCTPNPKGCDVIFKYLRDVLCCGNKVHFHYLLCWIHNLITSTKQSGVGLCLVGFPGSDKSTLGKLLITLLGKHHGELVSKYCIGRMSTHGKRLVYIENVGDEEGDHYYVMNNIKCQITGDYGVNMSECIDERGFKDVNEYLICFNDEIILPKTKISDVMNHFFVLNIDESYIAIENDDSPENLARIDFWDSVKRARLDDGVILEFYNRIIGLKDVIPCGDLAKPSVKPVTRMSKDVAESLKSPIERFYDFILRRLNAGITRDPEYHDLVFGKMRAGTLYNLYKTWLNQNDGDAKRIDSQMAFGLRFKKFKGISTEARGGFVYYRYIGMAYHTIAFRKYVDDTSKSDSPNTKYKSLFDGTISISQFYTLYRVWYRIQPNPTQCIPLTLHEFEASFVQYTCVRRYINSELCCKWNIHTNI